MFGTQMVNIALFIIIFISGLYIWANVLELKGTMKRIYPAGGLKEQPKDEHIDSAPLSSEWDKIYKRVDEEEAYILEIGDASWAGSKERMLEILIYNKMRYEKNGKPFDFEIYPMISKKRR